MRNIPIDDTDLDWENYMELEVESIQKNKYKPVYRKGRKTIKSRLKKPCLDCSNKFTPGGRFQKLCHPCIEKRRRAPKRGRIKKKSRKVLQKSK